MNANARGWGFLIFFSRFVLTLARSLRSHARKIFGEKKQSVCGQTTPSILGPVLSVPQGITRRQTV